MPNTVSCGESPDKFHFQHGTTPHCVEKLCENYEALCTEAQPCSHSKPSEMLRPALSAAAVDYLVDLLNTEIQGVEEELRDCALCCTVRNVKVAPATSCTSHKGAEQELTMLRTAYRELRETKLIPDPKEGKLS